MLTCTENIVITSKCGYEITNRMLCLQRPINDQPKEFEYAVILFLSLLYIMLYLIIELFVLVQDR